MTILITNTTVVTCDEERRIHYGAGLVIEGDQIAEIGPSAEVESKFPNSERINGPGKVVFPGLVNYHTHLLATADRGFLEHFGFSTTTQGGRPGTGQPASRPRAIVEARLLGTKSAAPVTAK